MRVLLLSPIWKAELPPLLDPELDVHAIDARDEAKMFGELADAEIVISAGFTKKMADAASRLRLLVCPAAGTDQIERSALRPGVRLVKGTGHEIPMAEYVVGCIVALRQHLFEADRALRRGEWAFGFLGQDVHEELAGSTLGLVGFGGIGQAILTRALAFGMRCAAVTLHPDAAHKGSDKLEFLGRVDVQNDVDRLVAWSDALALCCELSDVTRGLIDERRFGLMKRDAVFVNVARGAVADERALYEALAQRRIAGAAIDVWYRYPPKDSFPSAFPFWELSNVILTPHASAWTEAAKQRRLHEIARAINEFWRASARV
ncbi:MAG TPA: 2-hydroxyacid dehydrogenase [Candidatus Acidoferrales bacterium]|nr:2-hydroxyacid dehydrogenase [Candidatus Acidoferrales bacterium]